MPKRGENIYKRKDGRWEGRYKKGRTETGRLKYGYIYGKRYIDVKEQMYLHQLKYLEVFRTKEDCNMSYQEWALIWLNNRGKLIKSSTYSTYFYKLKKYIFPNLGSIPLNQLTREHIQDLVNQWEKQELKPTTIHVLYQIVKKTLNDAYEQGKITQQLFQGILLPRQKKSLLNPLSKSQQNQLENKAKSLPLFKGLPVLIALNTGLRIGEISALRWEDIDLKAKIIHVTNTIQRIQLFDEDQRTSLCTDNSKTDNSIRSIPMNYTIYKYLKKWEKKSKSPYVCSNKIAPAEPRLINYYFDQIKKDCHLEHTNFHHLRHTFVNRYI